MASSSNETYDGALEVLMKQIGLMKLLPDANLPFVIGLETMIIEEARNPERMMQKAGLMPPGGGNPQGMGGGMPGGAPGGTGGMSAPAASFAGAGVPGAGPQMAGPPPQNADELRRVLTAPGQ